MITGLLLLLYYNPTIDGAHESVQFIMARVAFGWLIRGIHHWGATLMVITVFLHMLRVFYHRAYRPPRQFNWVIGVVLLLLTLGLEFSVGEFSESLRRHLPSAGVDLVLNAIPGAVAGWLLGLDAVGIVQVRVDNLDRLGPQPVGAG